MIEDHLLPRRTWGEGLKDNISSLKPQVKRSLSVALLKRFSRCLSSNSSVRQAPDLW